MNQDQYLEVHRMASEARELNRLQDEYYDLLWAFRSLNKFDAKSRCENRKQRMGLKSKITTLKKRIYGNPNITGSQP